MLAMFSFRKFFKKDDQFFALLQASAAECRHSVEALDRVLHNHSMLPTLEDFVMARRKEKQIVSEMESLLVKSFMTPREPADQETISRALDRIPKTLEKFAERFILCAPQLREVSFGRQIEMLQSATDILVKMIEQLTQGPKLTAVKALQDELQRIEGDADKLLVSTLKTLYAGQYDTVKTVILKDLYELLEKGFDRCRDAGNAVFQVVLKNS